MCEFPLLKDQLKIYGENVELWQIDHRSAMRCYQVQDQVAFGLFILKTIRDHNLRWAQAIRDPAAFSWDDSRVFANLYACWLEQSRTILRQVEECERAGYSVERADEFREEIQEVSLLPLDTDGIRRAVEAGRRGEVISSTQALDELRSRLHA